jgi:quercetin dioxygenase-like cupin family protein
MGEVLERRGRRATVLVAREELVVFEYDMEARTAGASPHIHREHVDAFYVLEGELELMVAGETVHAHPGDLVHAPPSVVHAFKNSSDGRLRFINMHTPGMRFDEYIRKMDAGEHPDPAEYDSFPPP